MPPKRKRANDGQSADDGARNKRFAYLKPQVRQVSEKTIKSKWSTLPEPAQDKVRDMFRALERPVIVRHQNERKRIEAQAAVHVVVKNLAKRLPRMPFPPITKDSVFEYEAALKEHSSLEANLATVKDSTDLLKTEADREDALLAKEKKQLQEMEKNAKRAEMERKRQLKNEHPVLRKLNEAPSTEHRIQADLKIAADKNPQLTFDGLEDDPDTFDLLKQLSGHLNSIQNNIAPLDGLADAITRSQIALSLASMSEG
ncbi:hypothetical protein P170DRAFT_361212 [Aspergillus steynii IBT 23096]|uniref:CENP-Q, a CENPA-CAD centromere complex subunit-domain-containing protein n=1 Tax=Aspergillus steynii IBT 23096 TaxID=1392250 RepID=A0A2I2G4K8_9EURO|nr:uncharacterized protein P170DRAFT_361212 [Aspergillus steynii IBT 23096]PLB47816.1 hypothetical protein P170DRAFT_361212 [Aspergillus steynii IBT 23096]